MSANEKIEALLREARVKISEAEAIADETGETFNFDLAYGMGGSYYPEKYVESNDWMDSDDTGWVSSSAQC